MRRLHLHSRARAFTMAEMLIALTGSTIVVGALLFSAMHLQRSLHSAETLAACQADQRRLLDYVARDLRRAIGIGSTESMGGGAAVPLSAGSLAIENNTSLVLTLPGYYQSQVVSDPTYDQAFPVVAADNYVDYGDTNGHAPGVQSIFRRQYIATEKSICFVRLEGPQQEVIVRHAENIHLKVTIDADGRGTTVESTFLSPSSALGVLRTERESLLLRNVRLDSNP